jgi:RNA polymerase sigma-70 factor (ECF subfamily)
MSSISELDDYDLLRLMRDGSEEAFRELYQRRQGGVYRFALQMSGSAEVAEDVTQEVFLALIRAAGKYDSSRGPLASWLYGIARHHVWRWLERSRGHDQGAEAPEPCTEESPLEDLTRTETLEEVRQAVLALPPRYREVVALCDLHEMSYEETARLLGCAVGTVRSRLHRARSLLAEKLRARVRCSS